jgi:CheY-like chemotaxis protein
MGERKSVFVIEDNDADAFLIEEALAKANLNCDVKRFSEGEKALAALFEQQESTPDAILLDLHMPKLEGLDVLQRIRNTPRLSRVPVGILTGSSAPSDEQRAERLGATRYIHKPMSYEQFVNDIQDVVKEFLAPNCDL